MLTMTVTLRGAFFVKNLTPVVERAIVAELLDKAGARAERGGKGLGARVNRIRRQRYNRLELIISSTRIYPRTTGASWTRKNMSLIRAIASRGAPTIARRIISDLS